jgi:xanthine dehydrogenase accessory factor
VASKKKGKFLLDFVQANGVPAEQLKRVKVPAGLDLGGMTAGEIAVSILAEIVQRRHPKVGAEKPKRSLGIAPFPVDPVCGMPVNPAEAKHTLVVNGETLYFCCPHCKAAYVPKTKEPVA